jgi:SAM-dependent methyltransferase
VVHLRPDECYYAHLAVYRFALPFCRGGRVLDAGSGTGYGSAYLADHGARSVDGIEVNARGVAFSRQHFERPNLRFHVMDLHRVTGFPARHFDLLFSSNVLEHLADVPTFLRAACRLLRRDGSAVVAVPPITTEQARAEDLANPYHLNSWSPRQWHRVLRAFFEDVQCYRMGSASLIAGTGPGEPAISEGDFVFEAIALDDFYRLPTIGAIFAAHRPRAEEDVPPLGSPVTFVDRSFTRPHSFLRVAAFRARVLQGPLKRLARAVLPAAWTCWLKRRLRRQ